MTSSIDFKDGIARPVTIPRSIRVQQNIMAEHERLVLGWLCSRIPRAMTPDLLTAVGVAGAVTVLAGYIGSRFDPAFLWLATAGLFINWFGDSLDGSLARFRHVERPRYGYFLDHSADAISDCLIVVGLGLSPYARLDVALFVLIGYLLLSIHVFLFNHVYRIFQISFVSLGPTELRIGLCLMNTLMYLYGPSTITMLHQTFSLYDIVFASIALILISLFVFNVLKAARRLRREDVPESGPTTPRTAATTPEPVVDRMAS